MSPQSINQTDQLDYEQAPKVTLLDTATQCSTSTSLQSPHWQRRLCTHVIIHLSILININCTAGYILSAAVALECGHLISDAVMRFVHAASQLQIPVTTQKHPGHHALPADMVACTLSVQTLCDSAVHTSQFCAPALFAPHSLHARNTCTKQASMPWSWRPTCQCCCTAFDTCADLVMLSRP